MNRASLAVVLLIVALASVAKAERALPATFKVTKLAGWFDTFSTPSEESMWALDLEELTRAKDHGRLEFKHDDENRSWYIPYRGAFRVVREQKDDRGLRSLRLVNEHDRFRTTITLRRIDIDKQPTAWRGFFVFEEIDGEILGQFAFE
jgi:hypothetical protein